MNRKYKYIIVGQGLAGTLLSWQLKKNNVSHVVISSQKKKKASLVAAGMYNPLVFKRISKSWMVEELLPVMYKTYAELEQELDKKIVYPIPIAKLIKPGEVQWWEERIKSQQLSNYVDGFYRNEELPGINEEYDFVKIKNSGFVNPGVMLEAYCEKLVEDNMYVDAGVEFKDVFFDNECIRWQNIQAEKIVFCEGAHIGNNPFFREVKFYLTRGDVLEVQIEGLSENYIINKDVFLLPKGNRRYLLGSTYDHVNINWLPNLYSREYLLNKVSQLICKPVKLLSHIAGVRPTVKDRRPVLGYSSESKRIAMFNGLGTKGVMLGPYFSLEMFRMLEDEKHVLPNDISINRFKS